MITIRNTLSGALILGAAALATTAAPAFERVNLDSSGNPPTTGVAWTPSASADGRYVVFATNAPLVPADVNDDFDIYLRDRLLGTTVCLSVNTGGVPAGQSYSPQISADGGFVVFESGSPALVVGDTNGEYDIFVRDLAGGTTTRVSVATGGAQTAVFGSSSPSISGDGRLVAFASTASDLVAGDANGNTDIFVHDRQTATTTRISVGPAPGFAEADGMCSSPYLSEDGSTVVFRSFATTLTAAPTNGNAHIFACDLASGAIALVSKSGANEESDFDSGSPVVSPDGRYVVFESMAGNLAPGDDANNDSDIFLHDRQTGDTTRVSHSTAGAKQNAGSSNPSISRDGTLVAFCSDASNLAPEATNGIYNLYVRNLGTGVTTLITKGLDGLGGDDASWERACFVENDSALVFESSASNLVPNDFDTSHDIFHKSLAAFVPAFQPDNLIGGSSALGAAAGGNRYNGTGVGQTRTVTTRRARAFNAFLFVQNDGNAPDSIAVRGPGGNRQFALNYFAGSARVTGGVKAGGYSTGLLAPGAHRTLRVAVAPSRKHLSTIRKRKLVWLPRSYTASLASTSQSDPGKRDVAKLVVRHR